MENHELTRPLAAETAEQGIVEFGRSGPDAVTRPQTGEEKQLLLTRSGAGRRRDGVPVPLMLVHDTMSSLAWLASELAVKVHNDTASTLEQHWHIRVARDNVVNLSRILSSYELDDTVGEGL